MSSRQAQKLLKSQQNQLEHNNEKSISSQPSFDINSASEDEDVSSNVDTSPSESAIVASDHRFALLRSSEGSVSSQSSKEEESDQEIFATGKKKPQPRKKRHGRPSSPTADDDLQVPLDFESDNETSSKIPGVMCLHQDRLMPENEFRQRLNLTSSHVVEAIESEGNALGAVPRRRLGVQPRGKEVSQRMEWLVRCPPHLSRYRQGISWEPVYTLEREIVGDVTVLRLEATRMHERLLPAVEQLLGGGNPNLLEGALMRMAPLHVEGNLALASFHRISREHDSADKFVKTAVHGLQLSLGHAFSPMNTKSTCCCCLAGNLRNNSFDEWASTVDEQSAQTSLVLVPSNTGNNTIFYLTLANYLTSLREQGAYESSVEVCKLLLYADFPSDKFHSLIHLSILQLFASSYSEDQLVSCLLFSNFFLSHFLHHKVHDCPSLRTIDDTLLAWGRSEATRGLRLSSVMSPFALTSWFLVAAATGWIALRLKSNTNPLLSILALKNDRQITSEGDIKKLFDNLSMDEVDFYISDYLLYDGTVSKTPVSYVMPEAGNLPPETTIEEFAAMMLIRLSLTFPGLLKEMHHALDIDYFSSTSWEPEVDREITDRQIILSRAYLKATRDVYLQGTIKPAVVAALGWLEKTAGGPQRMRLLNLQSQCVQLCVIAPKDLVNHFSAGARVSEFVLDGMSLPDFLLNQNLIATQIFSQNPEVLFVNPYARLWRRFKEITGSVNLKSNPFFILFQSILPWSTIDSTGRSAEISFRVFLRCCKSCLRRT